MEDPTPDNDLIEMARDPSTTITTAEPPPIVNPIVTLSHLITTLLLPQRLTTLALPTPLSFPPSDSVPSPHPPTTSVLSVLHLRALEALNNVLLTTAASLPSEAATHIPSQGVWEGMFRIVSTLGAEEDALGAKGQEMRLEVLEMALGCLWGLVKIAPADLVSGNAEFTDQADA